MKVPPKMFHSKVTPQDTCIINFKSHSHCGWKGKFHVMSCDQSQKWRVVIGQILRVDSHAVWSLLWIKLSWAANVTLSPNINHTNSSDWSPYIEEFDKRAKHFSFGDHCINSHSFISWQSMDIVRRKLMLVSIGT